MRTRRTVVALSTLAPVLALRNWRENWRQSPEPVTTQSGISFSSTGNQTRLLDLYAPPLREQPRPGIVLIHGGGFVAGSRTDFDVVTTAQHLAEAGYVVASIDYRLVDLTTPAPLWPAPFDDAQRAVRWMRAHASSYGLDPERLGAYGMSAGAGLAALLGVRETPELTDPDLAPFSSRVQCVVELAGPVGGTIPPTSPDQVDVARALFGGTITQVPEVYLDASAVSHVDKGSAPFLVVHGLQDPVVPVAHVRSLVAALREAGVAVEIDMWSCLTPVTMSS